MAALPRGQTWGSAGPGVAFCLGREPDNLIMGRIERKGAMRQPDDLFLHLKNSCYITKELGYITKGPGDITITAGELCLSPF